MLLISIYTKWFNNENFVKNQYCNRTSSVESNSKKKKKKITSIYKILAILFNILSFPPLELT